ncbi:MAG: OmpH family outer membrane protein [Selenomonadaceae bacterium]|nr:OmpH family outer membrane protein [Selenomonadaceae bacterium]MBR4695104.1 OmpH family outer membrane protein [Selenomonadaceae bacterium]
MKLKGKTAAVLVAAIMTTMIMGGCGQVKVGYVDEVRIADEAPQIKATMEEANKKLVETQQELEKQFQEHPNMSMEEAQKLQQEAQRKAMGLNQQYMTQVQQKMNVALAEIAKEKQLDVVVSNEDLQKTILLGGIDVTNEAIQKLQ